MFAAVSPRPFIALLSLTACVTSARPSSDDVRAALTAVKQAVVRAYIDLDANALESLYTDDFTVTDAAGRARTKADELDYVRANPRSRVVSGRYVLEGLRVYGDMAVAAGRAEMRVRSSTGEVRDVRYRSFNVFRWENGRWRYAAAFTP